MSGSIRLTEHYFLDHFTVSDTAARKGIDNTPPPEIIQNLKFTAAGFERIGVVLGAVPTISSGYRSPQLNAAVGGSSTSQHKEGKAGDAGCPSFGSPRRCAVMIAQRQSIIQFDQLILEFDRWFHASFTTNPRGQILTAKKNAAGKTIYLEGLVP